MEDLSQSEIEYGEGWACYKLDDKEKAPVISWAFIKGFCAAMAEYPSHDYKSIKDAFVDFFGSGLAQELIDIATVELEKDQEWFRWPSIKTK